MSGYNGHDNPDPVSFVSRLDRLGSAALDRAIAALRQGSVDVAWEWMQHAAQLQLLERAREAEVLAELESGFDDS